MKSFAQMSFSLFASLLLLGKVLLKLKLHHSGKLAPREDYLLYGTHSCDFWSLIVLYLVLQYGLHFGYVFTTVAIAIHHDHNHNKHIC